MITVTDSAKKLLKKVLLTHTDDPSIVLRLSLKAPEQFGFVLDNEAEGDQVVEYKGSKVLLVDPDLAPVVDEATLDVQDTPEGPKLVVSKQKKG